MDVDAAFKDSTKLHHAYLIEDDNSIFARLPELLAQHASSHEEVYVREFDSFGIDESRDLSRLALMRSVGRQLFIYRVRAYTREAQNALLKLLEEPPRNTHFFFIVPSVQDVLPTLQSRVWTIAATSHQEDKTDSFVHQSMRERLNRIEAIVKEKDAPAAQALLRTIEQELASVHSRSPQIVAALRHIFNVRGALTKTGTSLKIVLESVALLTPVLSHTGE